MELPLEEDEKPKPEGPNVAAGYFNLKRILVDPASPPVTAHHLTWTRIGHEYTLDVGHFDPHAVREAIKKATKPDDASQVDLYITHQFTLSPEAMRRFLAGLEELTADLDRADSEKTEKDEDEHSEDKG